jgi:nitrite reductase/ring-hydroxylating ferredoxin subunit
MSTTPSASVWWVASRGLPRDGERLHTCLGTGDENGNRGGRLVTVFRQSGKLSAIDAVCHHAGGPMTLGPVSDIEDLGLTVVACPW